MGLHNDVFLMGKLGEPSLDPPDEPSETCQECGKELDDEAYEVEMPGRYYDVWVCSTECAAEYVSSWAETMREAKENAENVWN